MAFEIREIRHEPESSPQYEVYHVIPNKTFHTVNKLTTHSSLSEAENFIKSMVVYSRLESVARYNDDGVRITEDCS